MVPLIRLDRSLTEDDSRHELVPINYRQFAISITREYARWYKQATSYVPVLKPDELLLTLRLFTRYFKESGSPDSSHVGFLTTCINQITDESVATLLCNSQYWIDNVPVLMEVVRTYIQNKINYISTGYGIANDASSIWQYYFSRNFVTYHPVNTLHYSVNWDTAMEALNEEDNVEQAPITDT